MRYEYPVEREQRGIVWEAEYERWGIDPHDMVDDEPNFDDYCE